MQSRAGLLYLVALIGFLGATLLPFPRSNPFGSSRVRALPTGSIHVKSPSLMCSEPGPQGLNESAFVDAQFSVELVIRVTDDTLRGPARIVAHSADPSFQNWIIGQDRRELIVRHRGREVRFPHVYQPGQTQSLLVSLTGDQVDLYLDGQYHSSRRLGSAPQSWDSTCRVVIGNETTGDRPWIGEILRLRLFDAAVSPREIAESVHGPRYTLIAPSLDGLALAGRDEGEVVPIRLWKWPWSLKLQARSEAGYWASGGSAVDIIQNILMTIPSGFFLAGFLLRSRSRMIWPLTLVLSVQIAVSVAVEVLQFVSLYRHGEPADVLFNGIGALLGAAAWVVIKKRTRLGSDLVP